MDPNPNLPPTASTPEQGQAAPVVRVARRTFIRRISGTALAFGMLGTTALGADCVRVCTPCSGGKKECGWTTPAGATRCEYIDETGQRRFFEDNTGQAVWGDKKVYDC